MAHLDMTAEIARFGMLRRLPKRDLPRTEAVALGYRKMGEREWNRYAMWFHDRVVGLQTLKKINA